MQITLTTFPLPTSSEPGTLIEMPNQCSVPPTPPSVWVSNSYWLIITLSLVLRIWLNRRHSG